MHARRSDVKHTQSSGACLYQNGGCAIILNILCDHRHPDLSQPRIATGIESAIPKTRLVVESCWKSARASD